LGFDLPGHSLRDRNVAAIFDGRHSVRDRRSNSVRVGQIEWPMKFKFFDEKIASLYYEEQNTTRLIQLFAIIAVLIGSLGLYGLISYIISQKTKEISIRKVNGAKVSEILVLLNKDFMIYFAIAFIIACPIAYITMDNWLQKFAFKTDLTWWLFALAGGIAMLIALITVSGQTFTAARRNPVEAFRYE
jgi:putative ABC transport system permease protein